MRIKFRSVLTESVVATFHTHWINDIKEFNANATKFSKPFWDRTHPKVGMKYVYHNIKFTITKTKLKGYNLTISIAINGDPKPNMTNVTVDEYWWNRIEAMGLIKKV